MKTLSVIVCLLIFSMTAYAERCGTTLIEKGLSSYFIEKSCGTPQSKSVIGYTSDAGGYNKLVIEQWVYESVTGQIMIITMTGGVVTNVTSN